MRERKADKERDAIAEYLMAASGVQAEQWDLDLSPSPFKVQGLLYVRVHAFAMCGACHLGSWSLYISKFLEFYTADVGEHFRPPTVQEAEEADKAAMQEVFTLCFAGSSLDDALSNIAVDRDLLRHFLVPRPKLPKAASQPFAPRPSKEGRSGREPLKRKAEFTKRFNKRPRTGECWGWIDSDRWRMPECRLPLQALLYKMRQLASQLYQVHRAQAALIAEAGCGFFPARFCVGRASCRRCVG